MTGSVAMSDALAFLHQGEEFIKQGRWQEAADAFRDSIRLDPSNAWPYHHLGDALGRLANLTDAVEAYKQALVLAPDSPWTLVNLGNVLSRLEHWDQAEAAYLAAVALKPDQPETFVHLGDVLSRQGNWQSAAEAFCQSTRLDAENPLPHLRLGNAYCRLDLWVPAEAAYRRAMELDAEQALTPLHLGEVLVKLDRLEEAVVAFRVSIQLDADNPWSHHHLGDALGRLGAYSEAVAAYEQALSLAPESPWAQRNLGNALLKLNRWEEAATVYQQCLAVAVDDAETYINLGTALAKLERWNQAETAYLQARSLAADDARLTEMLAGVWLKLERWQEAASAYEQCLAASPDDAQLQRNLGIAVFKLETQKAYRIANPDSKLATASNAEQVAPPEPVWTVDHFGSRIFEIERWIEKQLPTFRNASSKLQKRDNLTADNARLLFILDNDFGELTTVMYLLFGQRWIDDMMVLVPERLYKTNNDAFPGRTFCYQSLQDVERVIGSFHPDIVFLCSGYLYAMHNIFSHGELAYLVDLLEKRNCPVVTADPFLGVLSREPIASLISIDVPDESDLALPGHVFRHLESVKAEQDAFIVEKLAGAEQILRRTLHLYPAHASSTPGDASALDAREIACFNRELVCTEMLQPEAGTKPHWVFILSATDLDTQLMFEAVRGFTEIVGRLLSQAIALGRRPIFIGPEKFIRDLHCQMQEQEGAELLTFCSFNRLASLLLTAEYAFYWNSVSHTILLRSFNGLPVILFDRGHLVRNVEAIYDRVVRWYYQGVPPAYLDHFQPLTLECLHEATADFRGSVGQMERDFQRAPDPKALVQAILDTRRRESFTP